MADIDNHNNKIPIKNIIFAGLAPAVEYFDFSLFAYVTVFISSNFFPDDNQSVAIIKTFGMFAAGYLMRPIGGIFFGNLGDKKGRKLVLIITMSLMALATLIIAITPTYNSIGILSVILIIISRMIQGFSVGGEYNGVLAMLSELSPDNKRGFITAFGTFFSGIGTFFCSVLIFIFSEVLTTKQMESYGWRVCFIIGFILAIIILILQFKQDESPEYIKVKKHGNVDKTPILKVIQEYPYQIFIVFSLAGYLGIVYYMVSTFLPSFLISNLHYTAHSSMFIMLTPLFLYFLTAPMWGKLSDKIGRKAVLLSSCSLLAIITYPCFYLINIASTSVLLVSIIMIILMLCISAATATFVVAINELFPTHLRFSGVGTGYNVSNALLGGTVPFVSSILVLKFGNLSPSLYAVIASIIIVIIIYKMPETKGITLEE